MQEIENKMVVDWAWDEIEYKVHKPLKRERLTYEEAEREDRECELI